MTSSTDFRYRKSKPRHPSAPCSRDGRPIEILHESRGLVLIKFTDVPDSGVYYGEYDHGEGVADDLTPVTPEQVEKIREAK